MGGHAAERGDPEPLMPLSPPAPSLSEACAERTPQALLSTTRRCHQTRPATVGEGAERGGPTRAPVGWRLLGRRGWSPPPCHPTKHKQPPGVVCDRNTFYR